MVASPPPAANPSPADGPASDAPQDPAQVFRQLQATPDGLSSGEVHERLQKYGPNALPEKKVSPLLRFLGAFWGPIAWMMELAAVLSAVVGDWTDFAIILVLLVVNSVVGFWEENSAGNAVAALKSQLAPKATVLRDGSWAQVASSQLVPGDVVTLKLGSVVPADGVLLGEDSLDIDQAALTGESLPVSRSRGQAVYSGSLVKRGEGRAVVTATGGNTFFGRTARLLGEASTPSEFQRSFMQLVNVLIVLAIVLVLIVFVTQLVKADLAGENIGREILRSVKFLLVLIVASIPIAAPVVLSLTMAVGATRLAREKAIVQRLSSIDELAGIDMLCSDKTGTLTLNQLSLGDPLLHGGTSAAEALLAAGLASSQESPDVIDAVVLENVGDPAALHRCTVEKYTPFDPVTKRTEALVRDESGRRFRVSKGAPQVILDLVAGSDPQTAAEARKQVQDLASRGYRALGVARADDQGPWRLLAILSISDPPRPDSAATLAELRNLGVGVKMLTGDQVVIARETARQLGLGTNILDAAELRHTGGGPRGMEAAVAAADGFGQVFPEDKYAVVSALQEAGCLVGMTGDGVNDAPALKKANVGIAVSGATDAARSAAAVVLTAPGLSVVARAVRLSRLIFARMNAYLIYRLTATIWILLFTSLSILVFNDYPVTAVMILLLAILNDGSFITIAYDNGRISPKPTRSRVGRIVAMAVILGGIGLLESFLLYLVLRQGLRVPLEISQSCLYLNLAVGQVLTLYAVRTPGPFWTLRATPPLVLATWTSILLSTLIATYGFRLLTPLGWPATAAIAFYTLLWFLALDVIKQWVHPVVFGSGGAGGKLRRWNRLEQAF